MIINSVVGGNNRSLRMPVRLVIKNLYRVRTPRPGTTWTNDKTTVLQYTSFNYQGGWEQQQVLSAGSQTVSYYSFKMELGDGSYVDLMDYLKEGCTVTISISGQRNNQNGLFNSYFKTVSGREDAYTIVAGSTSTLVTKTITFSASDFNKSTTAVDGTVLNGLVLYVSTGDSPPDNTSGNGGQYVWLSCTGMTIDGISFPVQWTDDWIE